MNNFVTNSVLLSTMLLLSTQQVSQASEQTVYADVELKVVDAKEKRKISFAQIEKTLGKLENEPLVKAGERPNSEYGELLFLLSGTLLYGNV